MIISFFRIDFIYTTLLIEDSDRNVTCMLAILDDDFVASGLQIYELKISFIDHDATGFLY